MVRRRRDPAKLTIVRTIRHSFGRFLAIMGIIALGSGFFAGLQVSKSAMVKTADDYYRLGNFYDFRLVSSLGLTDDDVAAAAAVASVGAAEGSVSLEFLADDGSDSQVVLKAHSITESMNHLELISGRLPEAPNECVLDAYHYGDDRIGTEIVVSPENDEDTLDSLAYDSYTVVGRVYSPYYLNYERGSSSIGSGSVTAFLYLPLDGFSMDCYTEIFVTLQDHSAEIYSDAYENLADLAEDPLQEALEERGTARYDELTAEPKDEIADGEQQLSDGWAEYHTAEEDGQQQLADAKQTLDDARESLDQGWQDYAQGQKDYEAGIAEGETKLANSQQELENASAVLAENQKTIAEKEAELQQGEAGYQDGMAQYQSGLEAYHQGTADYEASLDAYAAAELSYLQGSSELKTQKESLQTAETAWAGLQAEHSALLQGVADLNARGYSFSGASEAAAALAAADPADPTDAQLLADAAAALSGYTAVFDGSTGIPGFLTDTQAASAQLDALLDQMTGPGDYALSAANLAVLRGALDAAGEAVRDGEASLAESRTKLDAWSAALQESSEQLQAAKKTLEDSQAQLQALRTTLDDGASQLADGKAKLAQGQQDYESGLQQLEDGRRTLEGSRVQGKNTLEESLKTLQDGEKDYESGLSDYEDGQKTLEEELSDARAELEENEQKLADAKEELSKVEPATVYVLGRDYNTGYANFENDSKIVEGISRVFPVFFFLVAALVCITTMTRMVEDDRAQIGIMKALGYGSFAISKKYLVYAGGASLLGCLIGLSFGSYLMPRVLWSAYSIMYGFGSIVFVFNWPLAIASTVGYLACALGATWLSCRSELREVAAELIRPKTPKAGKRVLLEKLPFLWKHLSFLQKVSFRNVFRYKKRLFMMMVGIGGCTALLLTGFGIRDSIQNFVGYQFDEITRYDCTVTFADPLTEETELSYLADDAVESAAFVHMSSVDVQSETLRKSAYLVATDDSLDGFMDFHNGKEALSYPSSGECLINEKLAEQFSLTVGDTVTLYDSDRNQMSLRVTGVFDNYINNYIYTAEGSLAGWNGNRDLQCAFVNVRGDVDSAAAQISGLSDVSSVSVNATLRNRIESMMSSLNYIVAFVIFCAGALAFIVLYNLTNINIAERAREIATIKVLGFYGGEAAVYVFRENMILSFLGALIGLPLGKLLHAYVMGQIRIDMMYFDVRVQLLSYVISVLLTMAFALLVNFAMFFKIKGIDMAESLKSVD